MPAAHGNEVNVTPLIDVIMCLIIFFMLVAKIGVATGAKKMDLPYSYLGKKIEDMGNTFTLNVLPFGEEAMKAKNPAPGDLPRAIEQMQVSALVDNVDKDLPIQAGTAANPTYPLRETLKAMKLVHGDKLKVIIRADADLPYTQVQPVLMECENAGAQNVNFTTQSEAGGDPQPRREGEE